MISAISEDGLDYYDIPIGTPLYRGDTPAYKYYVDDGNTFTFNPGFYFFGTNAANVKQYGVVFKFQTIKSYRLLALDSMESLEKLNAKINDSEISNILDKNYGTTTGIRDSISIKDKQLCSFLCENGYQGYAILKDRYTLTGIFHHEVMICDPQYGIECVSVVTSDQDIKRLLDDYNLRKGAHSKKSKRKVESLAVSPPRRPLFGDSPPRRSLFDGSPPRGSLFGDSPPRRSLFDGSPPRRSLLGGNKHKTNRKPINKRKKRKSRKTRKP